MQQAYKKLDMSDLPSDPQLLLKVLKDEIERQNSAIFDYQIAIEQLQNSVATLNRKVADERLENGVLDNVIDKLIDKLARV